MTGKVVLLILGWFALLNAQVLTPTPAQAGPPAIQNSTFPVELFAILTSIFGSLGYRSSGTQSLFVPSSGPSEIAGSYGEQSQESYPSDIFQNVQSTSPSDLMTPYRVLGPFRKYYDGCISKAGLGSCKFVNLGVIGDTSHQRRRSCHNSAQAIDVGPLTCSSGRRILPTDPRFFEVAKCMANDTGNELQVIYYKATGPNMIQKSDHNNHMHIQLKNCSMVYGS